MSTWTEQKLGDVVEFIDGDRGKQYPTQGDFYPEGDCLFLSTANIPNNKFDFGNKLFITKKKDDELKKGKLKRNDYVLTTRGTVGNFAFYGNKIPFEKLRINSGMVILRKKSENLEVKYLQYFLSSDLFHNQVKARTSGSAQPQLPIRDMISIVIALPDITTQQKISSILAVYDDLIENNERRIRILEEVAQRLYTEWFVKFRFPGFEKTKMVDSGTEYGTIPEGWEVKKISEQFCTILGGTPSRTKSEYWENGNIPWVNSGAVNNLRIIEANELITKQALDKSAAKMMPKRTTLLAITGATLGQVSLTEIECCANQSVVGIYDEEGVLNEYLYLRIKNEIKNIIALAGGGAQQHINKDIVNNKVILIPNKKLAAIFFKTIEPTFNEISKLLFSNKNLSETRDLLIPQLVNGKREVKC